MEEARWVVLSENCFLGRYPVSDVCAPVHTEHEFVIVQMNGWFSEGGKIGGLV